MPDPCSSPSTHVPASRVPSRSVSVPSPCRTPSACAPSKRAPPAYVHAVPVRLARAPVAAVHVGARLRGGVVEVAHTLVEAAPPLALEGGAVCVAHDAVALARALGERPLVDAAVGEAQRAVPVLLVRERTRRRTRRRRGRAARHQPSRRPRRRAEVDGPVGEGRRPSPCGRSAESSVAVVLAAGGDRPSRRSASRPRPTRPRPRRRRRVHHEDTHVHGRPRASSPV